MCMCSMFISANLLPIRTIRLTNETKTIRNPVTDTKFDDFLLEFNAIYYCAHTQTLNKPTL